MRRAAAAGIAFALAAVSSVASAFVTTRPSAGLWVGIAVLIILGSFLQGVVTVSDRKGRRVAATGPAAVSIGGSAHDVATRVIRNHESGSNSSADIAATAPGAVSIGGNALGKISTEFMSDHDSSQP